MHNSRFREIAPSLEAELIATRVQFDYHPGDSNGEQTMVATWYGQEFLPVGDNLEPLGERGPPLRTTLSDYLTTVLGG